MSGEFDIRKHWPRADIKEKAERLSWSTPAMEQIAKFTQQLFEDGWRDAAYCPKDGSVFLAWVPTMSMPYRCKYEGQWPNGQWWAMLHGDMWPDRPMLWKPLPVEQAREELE